MSIDHRAHQNPAGSYPLITKTERVRGYQGILISVVCSSQTLPDRCARRIVCTFRQPTPVSEIFANIHNYAATFYITFASSFISNDFGTKIKTSSFHPEIRVTSTKISKYYFNCQIPQNLISLSSKFHLISIHLEQLKLETVSGRKYKTTNIISENITKSMKNL